MAPHANGASEDGEDDYMNMTFEEPKTRETLSEKKKRLAREAEARGRPQSKAQLEQEARAKRDAALNNKEIDTTSKGFKMMAALGYKPGNALGAEPRTDAEDDRLREPVGVEMREGRGGIGDDNERKRKFRAEVAAKEEDLKKQKVEGDFRQRQQQEREEKKMEGQVYGAMKICERLDEEDADPSRHSSSLPQHRAGTKPLSSINVLWRGLVKERAIRERDKRMRRDLQTSSVLRPAFDDPDEDGDDRLALPRNNKIEEEDIELDQDDNELDEFQALPVSEKLERLVDFLRSRWQYCFWCKHRYSDEGMEGCPGKTEEDHD
jgi:hypothetical protein